MRFTDRNLLSTRHHQSFDDLYQIICNNNTENLNDQFWARAVELEQHKSAPAAVTIMPQTEHDTNWHPVANRYRHRSLRRRPSSEPIVISNCHLSFDHEMPHSPSTIQSHMSEMGRIRHLTEKGVPICGSPMKPNYLANYRPSNQTSPIPSPSPSLRSSVDLDAFSFISSSSFASDTDDEHEDFQQTGKLHHFA